MENKAKPLRLVHEREVRHRLADMSRTTFWRLKKSRLFPEPVKAGKRNTWLESDIDAYIQNLASQGGLAE